LGFLVCKIPSFPFFCWQTNLQEKIARWQHSASVCQRFLSNARRFLIKNICFAVSWHSGHHIRPRKSRFGIKSRVARWFTLRPKIQMGVYSRGPRNGKRWYILRPFGIIDDLLV
jgi:hypothetical protein